MKVLGVNSLTHNSGVALCVDGKIKYAVEEERFSRIKHHGGIEVEGKPPYKSLEWVLSQAGISLSDIDKIVHAGWPGDNFLKLDIIRKRFREFAGELDPEDKKSSFVDHHEAHAASAYFASGFNDALALSIDGSGDWISTSFYIGKGHELKKVDEYFVDQSIGFLYSRAAQIIGLGGFGCGEGKLVALAAYGKPLDSFPSPIELSEGRYRLNKNYFDSFKKFKNDGKTYSQEHKDFAATIQNALENLVEYLVNNLYNKYGKRNLVIGGGVGLNCRMNGKLNQLPWVDQMFVQPAANDGGLCVGAAYLGALEMGDKPVGFDSIYLGPNIIENEVEEYVKKNGLNAIRVEDPSQLAAKLISNGETLAWIQGRLEFGPRALGHRSLIGDPRSMEVRDKLNVIKQREYWRPVAPSIIQSSKEYFDSRYGSEYMTHAIDMNDLAVKDIPGAIHVDKTARVQIVKNKDDRYYQLIKQFEKITGIPAVLNTSLNAQGEPLCTTIDDGVKFFYSTPTDNMIIDKYWFKK